MALTRIFQIASTSNLERPIKTYLSRERCEKWLNEEADYSDYMGSISLIIQEIWTNKSEADIKKMLSK